MARSGDSSAELAMLDSPLSQKRMKPARRSSALIRFGVFEADVYSGELRKGGVKVKIQDLPFRALRLLLSHPHEVLSRDQFRQFQ